MPRSSTPCTTRRERTRCGRSAGAVTPRRQDPARPAGCIRMHKPVRKRALRQSHLTTPSVRRSVKVLNATAGWDRCRRPRAVIPRDTLATQNVSSLPTQSSGRSFVQKPSRGHFTSGTHPRRAGWNATIAGRYIDRKPSGGPPESSRHFAINSSEPFFSRQLETARTRRRLPPQQHLPEDTGHTRVTSEFADVGRFPARIPRIEMFPASVDKLFLHRFSLQ
jgi:hypothetical protein